VSRAFAAEDLVARRLLRQIREDHTSWARTAAAESIAAPDEIGQTALEPGQFLELMAYGLEMSLRDGARPRARPALILSQRDKRSHLLERKAESPALPDEGHSPAVALAIASLAAIAADWGRKQSDLFVVSDGGCIRARAPGKFTNLHDADSPKRDLNLKLLEGLSSSQRGSGNG